MKSFSFLVAFLVPVSLILAQTVKSVEHDKVLNGLSDEEKVDYIIENYYALYSDDFDNALKLTSEAAAISRRHNWKEKEARCEMFQGVILYLKGDFEKVLPKYQNAQNIFDSLNHYDGLARLHNEMAVFYRRHTDVQTANMHLDKAEEFARKANNNTELGTAYGHRATLLDREGKTDEAFLLYKKVYDIRLEEKDSVGMGYVLLDLASIALREGDLKKSLDLINQSTAIRTKLGDKQGVAINLVNTGETYFSVKDYKNAISYFKQCLELATSIGYADLIRYTHGQLADAYVQINDFKSAFDYQKRSQAFNDSLFNINKTKVIADLQTKYETEKKEQQIALQKSALTEQQAQLERNYVIIISLILTLILLGLIVFLLRQHFKRKQKLINQAHELSVREAFILASIESQETERKRFAQDLHDGMGQLLSSLRLTVSNIKQDVSTEERLHIVTKSEKILNEIHREIRGIAFNLMPQTLIQFGLPAALEEMALRINETGGIIIHFKSFDVSQRLSEVQEISLYRIVQEWVNNVMKYAAATKIEIQLVGHEQEITITVEDDGNGFAITNLGSGKGNGWKNIQSRINLIKAIIDIDSNPNRRGSTLTINMPVKGDVKNSFVNSETVVLNTH